MTALTRLLEEDDLETLLASGFMLDVEEARAELAALPEGTRRKILLRIQILNEALKKFVHTGTEELQLQHEKVLQADHMKSANLLYQRSSALAKKH